MAEPALDELDLVIKTMATTIVDNAEYFAQLDSIVGDGDFGFSLRNGFEVVQADYDSWDKPNTGAVLKKIGLTISGKVGGCQARSGAPLSCGPGSAPATRPSSLPTTSSRFCAPRLAASSSAANPTWATRRCSTHSSRLSTASRRASPTRPRHRPRGRRAPAGGRRRSQGGRGHETDDRQAGPRGLHGRAKHRLGGRRGHGHRRDLPGHKRRVAREVRNNRRVNG